ncbi:YebC/PmpR family DNA-binding transcriptional regulator [Allorhodopirellula heiligendammensis]|uniref:Probable transcriptional regulatory protein Poly21_06250 n=1 Tax=Allorhodopirellula heiligendammensis TaxID=2714739 RepID=A0A5C6C2P8_9BACT|nr:YebC/PmpR family DNA-binding transcriptional regulator [Allorhodopirellula heiligendammensis]TWU18462.1 putative transcriptional regulatory protein [Allorhodopirellula heiligendammensis]
MAGHSKWANIQHRKGRVDAARGKQWSKLSKAIIVAAKGGGGDPAGNIRLRKAIDDAKAVSMPKDNIERAIKRGTGELGGDAVEEVLYEGYGPGGVAVMCLALTDNRNRTAPELRTMFGKHGGELGKTGCVSYLFERKGLFLFAAGTDEDHVTEVALENGAEDVETDDEGQIQVTCAPDNHDALSDAFEKAELQPEVNEVTQIASTNVDVDKTVSGQMMSLLEALDDHDDIQTVSTNANFTDE